MSNSFNIVLAGVGGQGTLLAGKLFALLADQLNLDVKVSEVHGMAQRGGSVITYVRMSEKVFSPIIEPGAADYVLAFEELEGVRWAHLLRQGGSLLVNTRRIIPMSVAMGLAEYPSDIVDTIVGFADSKTNVYGFDVQKIAEEAGSIKAVNFVMIGALSQCMGIDKDVFYRAIDKIFANKKPQIAQMNKDAFDLGSAIIKTK